MDTELKFNDEQIEAISGRNETVVVMAGPGSGKTHTLVGRIIDRFPRKMVVITFTNNAARVITERLDKLDIRLSYIGTLHGYCMRLIQEYGPLIGYRAGCVSIATDQAAAELLAQVKTDLRSQITDKELEARATQAAKLLWQEYEFRLKRANMIDYDGILRDGLTLLTTGAYKNHCDELLVDERQDSGVIDTKIFWAIPAKTRFFVGDVDQCIYGFRDARPDIFSEEAGRFGYVSLEKNYRSDHAICRCANDLIAHNSNRVDKVIKPVSRDEGIVIVGSYDHEGDEIYGVWQMIKGLKDVHQSNIAILARTNAIAEKFRDTLRGLGVSVARDLWDGRNWDLERQKGDYLTVTTVHGAKGSEWDVVFMVGMEEGVFPSKQAISGPGLEEERRLCFVGVTRAKHRLYLSWAHRRTAFFKTTTQVPSRFLAEMGMPQEI